MRMYGKSFSVAPFVILSPIIVATSLLSLIGLSLPVAAHAETWLVPGEAPTIQAGIDSASAGDTVLVASNTYYEYDIAPKSGVVLTSETGEYDCVTVDAQKLGRVFNCVGVDSNAVIKGFTILNGGNVANGGGIYLENSDPEIINCSIRKSRASSYGGGICALNSSPDVIACLCSADTADALGGGLYVSGTSSPYFSDCGFSECRAGNAGGGIYVSSGASAEFTVCSIELNYGGSSGGGGAYVYNASATFNYCPISRNLTSPDGAGLYCANAISAIINGCLFHKNQASRDGGAIYASGSSVNVSSCTFHANYAGAGGSSLFYNNSGVTVDNTIMAFGTMGPSVYGIGTAPTFTCTDIFGNEGGDWYGPIAGQYGINGNFSEDPLFCDRETFVLSLRTCSPCLDAPGCGLVGAVGLGDCPKTWHVVDDAPTIQAGIDSACGGDTVIVDAGTYYEYDIDMKSGVELRGEAGPAPEPTVTIDAQGNGRVITCMNMSNSTHIEGITITGGLADYGAGMSCVNSSFSIENCHFTGNEANLEGGGIRLNNSHCTISNCVFSNNISAYQGGGAQCYHANPVFTNCTFFGNAAYYGGGIYGYISSITLDNSIIAFSTMGYPVYCDIFTDATLSCCDVYGNAGGDWVYCIADQANVRGNLRADPRFCEPGSLDFRLSSASACLHQPCGLVGARSRGCQDSIPYIFDVQDVGNDQGRQVRLIWQRSGFDAAGDAVVITGYGIYRRQDENLAGTGQGLKWEPAVVELAEGESTAGELRGGELAAGEAAAQASGLLRSALAQGWDYISSVPARYDSIYQFVAPTLCDSTDEGICLSVFMISAETADPGTYFDSHPDSGYSIDNLAPAPPPGLIMSSPVELAWDEVPDEDFDYYSVYGSDQPELDESASLIGYTIETQQDITGHVYDYYHVTATDFAGNEGEESSVGNTYAGVLDPDAPGKPDADIPERFRLKQCKPNPFDASTMIAFELPRSVRVTIEVFDTFGGLVKKLDSRDYDAGRHAVVWYGDNDRGHPVSTGAYFIRLVAGDFVGMNKVILMR